MCTYIPQGGKRDSSDFCLYRKVVSEQAVCKQAVGKCLYFIFDILLIFWQKTPMQQEIFINGRFPPARTQRSHRCPGTALPVTVDKAAGAFHLLSAQ